LLADGFALGYATAGDTPELKGPLDELSGEIAWVYGDLTDPKVPEQLVSDVVEKLGRIDVLVNNAGLSTAKPFFDLTAADFDLTFDVDVRASFLLAQAAATRMRDQGTGGSIVNITSVDGTAAGRCRTSTKTRQGTSSTRRGPTATAGRVTSEVGPARAPNGLASADPGLAAAKNRR